MPLSLEVECNKFYLLPDLNLSFMPFFFPCCLVKRFFMLSNEVKLIMWLNIFPFMPWSLHTECHKFYVLADLKLHAIFLLLVWIKDSFKLSNEVQPIYVAWYISVVNLSFKLSNEIQPIYVTWYFSVVNLSQLPLCVISAYVSIFFFVIVNTIVWILNPIIII